MLTDINIMHPILYFIFRYVVFSTLDSVGVPIFDLCHGITPSQ